ncbi:MAG: GNAT family N-acetyltransferase [Candidatus Thiodiazotropha sp. (ex Epidulcina cf. delphinae)]|nr:GNAT family N-acetyltransferase [Candidatus Thiodiazotropha sp. (ex Epidulcina cf. delphinae)]
MDKTWQGKRVGVGMLKDAFIRTLVVAEQAGIRALLVHALSKEAKAFYLQWGFHESPVSKRFFQAFQMTTILNHPFCPSSSISHHFFSIPSLHAFTNCYSAKSSSPFFN